MRKKGSGRYRNSEGIAGKPSETDLQIHEKEVLIIGGGFAGLSAGVELASRGHHVTLIEGRGHLGGRAYSFRDTANGATVDNGQHVLMGCYTATLDFLEKIGTRHLVDLQKNMTVDFAAPGGKHVRFRGWPLPAPFHLLAGFASFRGLSLRDKISALRVGRYFQDHPERAEEGLDRRSVSQWLDELRQTSGLQEKFWNPLVYAALNDRPDVCSAALFEPVLREAFFSGRSGSRIGVPKVGLSELYTEASRDYIEKRGGQFLLKSPVVRLHFKGWEFQEAELEGGRRISSEALLVTAPFASLRKMLPESLLYEDPFFSPLAQLKSSPIVAINLWFDRQITDRPFVGFWGTRVHWLFNKGHFLEEGNRYISLVISGAREELKTPGPRLIEMALEELRSIYPEAAAAKLIRSTVSKEPDATLAPAVGVTKFRLPQKTPYRNLFLAGDWTDTGLPATIESAVRSAKKAVGFIENRE